MRWVIGLTIGCAAWLGGCGRTPAPADGANGAPQPQVASPPTPAAPAVPGQPLRPRDRCEGVELPRDVPMQTHVVSWTPPADAMCGAGVGDASGDLAFATLW